MTEWQAACVRELQAQLATGFNPRLLRATYHGLWEIVAPPGVSILEIYNNTIVVDKYCCQRWLIEIEYRIARQVAKTLTGVA